MRLHLYLAANEPIRPRSIESNQKVNDSHNVSVTKQKFIKKTASTKKMDIPTLVNLVLAGEITNDALADIVSKRSSLKDSRVIEAMRRVDRARFLPPVTTVAAFVLIDNDSADGKMYIDPKVVQAPLRSFAYNDEVLPIGYGQTCSQPHIVALMTDMLELKEGMKVLEIGTGCGYHAAVTSEMVGKKGKVTSIECVPELAELGKTNLKANFGKEFEKRFNLILGDGSEGAMQYAPFDRIYLTASADLESFDYRILVKQLNLKDGILLFPQKDGVLVPERAEAILKMKYKDGKIESQDIFDEVAFVPLVSEKNPI